MLSSVVGTSNSGFSSLFIWDPLQFHLLILCNVWRTPGLLHQEHMVSIFVFKYLRSSLRFSNPDHSFHFSTSSDRIRNSISQSLLCLRSHDCVPSQSLAHGTQYISIDIKGAFHPEHFQEIHVPCFSHFTNCEGKSVSHSRSHQRNAEHIRSQICELVQSCL